MSSIIAEMLIERLVYAYRKGFSSYCMIMNFMPSYLSVYFLFLLLPIWVTPFQKRSQPGCKQGGSHC